MGFEEVSSVSGVLEVSVSEVGVVRVEGIDEMCQCEEWLGLRRSHQLGENVCQ